LSRHVKDGGLECRIHHGKTKLADKTELDDVNVVLTTYHTVSAEWAAGKGTGNSILFSVRWRRIVLDEGELL
jgi:SNF2 family DNA or RNA helicase